MLLEKFQRIWSLRTFSIQVRATCTNMFYDVAVLPTQSALDARAIITISIVCRMMQRVD